MAANADPSAIYIAVLRLECKSLNTRFSIDILKKSAEIRRNIQAKTPINPQKYPRKNTQAKTLLWGEERH
jgi:hypothetical protein